MRPHAITTRTDRGGQVFEIGHYDDRHLEHLCRMYESFSPRPAAQGLPPENPEMCIQWVKHLLAIGRSLLAWRSTEVIGHAALIPDRSGGSCEFVVFVHQEARNRGIGTELTRSALDLARDLCFDTTWLTVEASNYVAIRLYRRTGFVRCDDEIAEWTMAVNLGQR
jgi:GNAT superfamily N-acetyltransferase